MSKVVVLDTSAILAIVNSEAGAEAVQAILFDAVISTVTLAEVHTKLSEWHGRGAQVAKEVVFALHAVIPFSEEQAVLAGGLRFETRRAGLSLGDRACLAVAMLLGVEVYTADRKWAGLDLPCEVKLIR